MCGINDPPTVVPPFPHQCVTYFPLTRLRMIKLNHKLPHTLVAWVVCVCVDGKIEAYERDTGSKYFENPWKSAWRLMLLGEWGGCGGAISWTSTCLACAIYERPQRATTDFDPALITLTVLRNLQILRITIIKIRNGQSSQTLSNKNCSILNEFEGKIDMWCMVARYNLTFRREKLMWFSCSFRAQE